MVSAIGGDLVSIGLRENRDMCDWMALGTLKRDSSFCQMERI